MIKQNQNQHTVSPGPAWAAALAASAVTCLILNSGYFLALPVFGDLLSGRTAVLFLIAAVLYRYGFVPFEGRRLRFGAAFGFLMGVMTLLGFSYSRTVFLARSPLGYGMGLLAAWLLFTAGVSVFLRLLDREAGAERPVSWKARTGPGLWLFFMVLTGCVYVPVFLAVYPGIYSYDASVQVLQCFGGMPLSTHHPLLHTLFLCGCLKAGLALFGSAQAGMAIHSVLQSAFVGAAFSLVLCRMRRRGAPGWLLALCWLFLVLNPYLTVFSFVTTKDVLFGAFFLLAFDMAFELTASPCAFLKDRRRVTAFGGFAILFCLLRNQGIYVFLFFALFTGGTLYISGRNADRGNGMDAGYKAGGNARSAAGAVHAARAFFLLSAAVTAAWYLLSGPVPALLGAEKGDIREMLSVPMQQLARVYHEEPEALSEEEKSYIETLIDPAALAEYVRVNADPVKSGFCTEVLKEDPGRFFKVWASVGLRMPKAYLDSFLMGNWGYWYPGATQYWISYILFDGAFLDADVNILGITRSSRLPRLEAWLRGITLTPAFEKVSVLRIPLNQAFPFWLALFAAAAVFYKREKGGFLPFLFLFGYWGTLLLGPVTGLRYALPLLYCVPVTAERIWHNRTKKSIYFS